MGKGIWWTIGLVLLFRAITIGAEDTANIIQQTLQSIQWVGFLLLAIVALLAEIVLKKR